MSTNEMGSLLSYSDDLANAEAPKALPAREYPGEIMGAELGISQSSGRPRVAVTFRIAAEDFPADYEDAEAFADGKTVMFYIGAGDDKASRFRMRKFLEAINAPMGSTVDLNDWIGRRASLSIEQEEYNGTARETIRRVEAL